jgi:biopolymer transport protein ExbD
VATETTAINVESNYLGNFTVARGHVLDLDVTGNGSALDLGSPRLIIYLAGHEQEDASARIHTALLLCFLGIPVGIFMLIRAVITNREERAAAFLRSNSFTQPGGLGSPTSKNPFRITFSEKRYGPRQQTGAHGPLYPRLPTMSLILVSVLEVAGMASWLVSPFTSRGLPIRLLRHGYVSQPSSRIQPLLIYVDRDHRLLLSGQVVPPGDFESVLRSELPLRPPAWPVYVEGDHNLEWLYVVRVIEAVQPYGRNVVLLKSRQPSSSGAK